MRTLPLKRLSRLRSGGGSTSLKTLTCKIGNERHCGGGGGFKFPRLLGGASSRFPNRPDGKRLKLRCVGQEKRLQLL